MRRGVSNQRAHAEASPRRVLVCVCVFSAADRREVRRGGAPAAHDSPRLDETDQSALWTVHLNSFYSFFNLMWRNEAGHRDKAIYVVFFVAFISLDKKRKEKSYFNIFVQTETEAQNLGVVLWKVLLLLLLRIWFFSLELHPLTSVSHHLFLKKMCINVFACLTYWGLGRWRRTWRNLQEEIAALTFISAAAELFLVAQVQEEKTNKFKRDSCSHSQLCSCFC